MLCETQLHVCIIWIDAPVLSLQSHLVSIEESLTLYAPVLLENSSIWQCLQYSDDLHLTD